MRNQKTVKARALFTVTAGVLALFLFTACGKQTNVTSTAEQTKASDGEEMTETMPSSVIVGPMATTPAETTKTSEPTAPPETTPIPTTEAPSIPATTAAVADGFTACNKTLYPTDTLNVRRTPSTDGEKIGSVKRYEAVTCTGQNGEWSRIEYNGQTAYIATRYCTEEKLPTTLDLDYIRANYSAKEHSYGYDQVNHDEKNVSADMPYYTNLYGAWADFVQDTSKNVIYLTIDEGYERGNTGTILDILKEKQVTAVFFLTGEFVDTHPELVQRMIDEGHILGNHTDNHPSMSSLSLEDQYAEIMNLHNAVKSQFGYEMHLFRYPSGMYSEQGLELVRELGYRAVFWSFHHRDFYVDAQPDVAESLALCLRSLHPGAIYLLHAVSDTNTALMADFIDGARAAGYTFGVYPVTQ